MSVNLSTLGQLNATNGARVNLNIGSQLTLADTSKIVLAGTSEINLAGTGPSKIVLTGTSEINLNENSKLTFQPAGAVGKLTLASPPALAANETEIIGRKRFVNLAAAGGAQTALTASDSGKLIIIPALAAPSAIAIPAAAGNTGVYYEFLMTALAGNPLVITPAGGSQIGGVLFTSAGANPANGFAGAQGVSLTFTATGIQGDYARVTCNGVSWFVQAVSHAAAGISMP